MPPSSSTSTSNPQWLYDVFINFRGKDTRGNFVSHLYAALSNAGINTFLDDEELRKGEELGPELLRAIQGSQIAIVVFSENYVHSSWCLDELVQIMEFHETKSQVVMPVFYRVTPSFIRQYARHTFGESIEIRKDPRNGARTKDWYLACSRRDYNFVKDDVRKKALSDASYLSGWDMTNYSNENSVVKEIVGKILKRLDKTYLPIPKFLVGLESRAEQLIRFLKQNTTGVCLVGIWGMGGIGKSTIAKFIYNNLWYEFDDQSFLANIREVWGKDRGPTDLQEQLLSDILKKGNIKVHSVEWGKAMINERLCTKRALVVLDDVSTCEQLDALCGNRNGIGKGSIIIITTRDVRLLDISKVDFIYEAEGLNAPESLKLFNWHTFKEASPTEGFLRPSADVVSYCGGLPLALEVLGSYLFNRTKQEWKSVLSKLKKIPNNQIQDKLKISFDGLRDRMEKDIFLDVCCFFIGKDISYVTEILNGCGLHADIGIAVLIERSLIKVEKNSKLGMHDLLRDMGREIVRESSTKKPEKRSRLWCHEDVVDVLTNHSGTKAIEGLVMKLQRTSTVSFNTIAFEKMKRLRLLQLDHVRLIGNYQCFSKHLKWLSWQGFPLKYIPENFCLENLVAMDLKRSNLIQVWKKPQLIVGLKFLNLSHSKYLKSTPNFSKLPNLEKLIMKDSQSLSEVHPSIGDLKNLFLINLKDCTSLSNLPKEIYQLTSVKTLILSGCSKIDKLEEDILQMKSLTTLVAANTGVKQVPFSIVRSKSIAYISICGYEGLSHDVFPSIIRSWLSPTINSLPHIPPFGGMPMSRVSLDIESNDLGLVYQSLSKIRTVSVQCDSEIQLKEELRRFLDDLNCAGLTEVGTTHTSQITDLSLRSLLIRIGNCHIVIDTLGKSLSQELTTNSSNSFLPGDNYPSWLAYMFKGPSVVFQVPEDNDCCMKGITLCVIYSSTHENLETDCFPSVLIINYTKFTIQIFKQDTVRSFDDEDWQGLISNLGVGDNVEIFVAIGHGFTVKEMAVYLVYDPSNVMEIEPLNTMEVDRSTETKIEPLQEVEGQPSPNVKSEASAEEEVQPSPRVQMEPSPDQGVQVSPNEKMEPSAEEEVQPSPHLQTEPSADEGVQPSPSVKMEPSAEEEVQPSPRMHTEPSADEGVQVSPNEKMEPSTEEEVQPAPHVQTEPSSDEGVQVSPNEKMEPSAEEEVQPSPYVQTEPSADEGVQLSPNVKMEPSTEEEVQPAPHVQTEPSADEGVQVSPNVKMEPSAEEEVQRNNYELQESSEKHAIYSIDTQTIRVDSDEEYESLQIFKRSRKVNKSDHLSDGESASSVPPITSKEKSDSLRKEIENPQQTLPSLKSKAPDAIKVPSDFINSLPQKIVLEKGSSTESTLIISLTAPRMKQEKVNESITSKSSTSKGPSATEKVSSKQGSVYEHSLVDYSKYKELIEEDPLAMMEKLLSGELSFSSKTSQSTKQAEATQAERVPINTLLDDLRHLVFSSNLLNYLPNDTNRREKVKGLLFEINDRVDELSEKQVLGLDEFTKIFDEAAVIIDDSRDNADSLQELELNHKNTISKLQASKDKIKTLAESISTGQYKIEDINNQIEDIQTQIQLLKEQVNKHHQEKSLLVDTCSKCHEKRVAIMKDIKSISSEAVEILEKTSHLEEKEQEFNLNYKRLQEHYTKMKLAPPF